MNPSEWLIIPPQQRLVQFTQDTPWKIKMKPKKIYSLEDDFP